MPHIDKKWTPAVTALVLALAVLTLAACGGSSKSSGATASKTSTAASAATRGGRFAAVRECLQKNGITLPARPPGQGRPRGSGGLLGGGGAPPLPSGVNRAQYEAALKKCGARNRGGAARLKSPAYKKALTDFAACMRENGVSLPAPNTSGTGPVFDTKAVNTTSPQFRSAVAKCQPILSAARGPGRAGSGAPGAGPSTAG